MEKVELNYSALSRGDIRYFPPGGIKGATNIYEVAEAFAERLKRENAFEGICEVLNIDINNQNPVQSERCGKYSRIWFGHSQNIYEPPSGIDGVPLGERTAEVLPTMYLYPPEGEYHNHPRVMCPKLQVQTKVKFEEGLTSGSILNIAKDAEKMEGEVIGYLQEIIPPEWGFGELVGRATVSCLNTRSPWLKLILDSNYNPEEEYFFEKRGEKRLDYPEPLQSLIGSAHSMLAAVGEPSKDYLGIPFGQSAKELGIKMFCLGVPSGSIPSIPSRMINYREPSSKKPIINILSEDRTSPIFVENILSNYRKEGPQEENLIAPPIYLKPL
jgi:hypothetical protein